MKTPLLWYISRDRENTYINVSEAQLELVKFNKSGYTTFLVTHDNQFFNFPSKDYEVKVRERKKYVPSDDDNMF